MYTHKVLFDFKDGVTSGQIRNMYDSIVGLKNKISEIRQINIMGNLNLIMDDKTYEGGFQIIFDNSDGLAKYLPHPEHDLVSKTIKLLCDPIKVKDYSSSN